MKQFGQKYLFVLCIDNTAMGIYPTMKMAYDSLALSGTLTFSVGDDMHKFGEIIAKNLPHDWTIQGVKPCTKDDVPRSICPE